MALKESAYVALITTKSLATMLQYIFDILNRTNQRQCVTLNWRINRTLTFGIPTRGCPVDTPDVSSATVKCSGNGKRATIFINSTVHSALLYRPKNNGTERSKCMPTSKEKALQSRQNQFT